MEKQLPVSVIIPCYNQGKFLKETVDSVISQSFADWECIIIDDGSADNTASVAKELSNKDPRIRYIYQENQGVSVARNNAIRQSSGKYILPLDADDLIAPTYLEEAVDYLEEHPEVKVVYCKAEKFGAVNCKWNLPDYDFNKMLFENLLFCTALFRRSDFDKCGGYNENMKAGIEDWDFWLSLLGPDDKVYRIDKVLFYYRIKEVSRNTVAKDDEKMTSLFRTIYENHKDYYQEYTKDIIRYVRKCNAAQGQIDRLNSSVSMRIGKMFTKPFSLIKDTIKKIK